MHGYDQWQEKRICYGDGARWHPFGAYHGRNAAFARNYYGIGGVIHRGGRLNYDLAGDWWV